VEVEERVSYPYRCVKSVRLVLKRMEFEKGRIWLNGVSNHVERRGELRRREEQVVGAKHDAQRRRRD